MVNCKILLITHLRINDKRSDLLLVCCLLFQRKSARMQPKTEIFIIRQHSTIGGVYFIDFHPIVRMMAYWSTATGCSAPFMCAAEALPCYRLLCDGLSFASLPCVQREWNCDAVVQLPCLRLAVRETTTTKQQMANFIYQSQTRLCVAVGCSLLSLCVCVFLFSLSLRVHSVQCAKTDFSWVNGIFISKQQTSVITKILDLIEFSHTYILRYAHCPLPSLKPLALDSLHGSTKLEFPICVFDDGFGWEVQTMLQMSWPRLIARLHILRARSLISHADISNSWNMSKSSKSIEHI